ncbi:L-threonine 3-dehydrogenase [Calothrix sp. NIES-2098]|uniref:L-threonine 3-dehydrogenase n=1 Tax=Calothrix sp. NIES-2098 TaxID=1954171 RepID=UPI000B60F7A4|nr:zinc-containing alcohol dehydrogenase superfamily protein [Calothrix sp. NIES-2098]
MKALVKQHASRGLWMTDVPKPVPGSQDVLIRIEKSAICGTDVHIYEWDGWAQKNVPVPTVIGHEFMGVIEEVGSDVQEFKVGYRVSGEGHITCGRCRNCRTGQEHLCRKTLGVGVNRHGSFAEYLILPAKNVFPLIDEVSDDIAAIFDPFGNATHAALSFDLLGEDVLITGAGPIGALAAAICKHAGARHIVVTDVNDSRLEKALQMGATRVVNVSREPLWQVAKELGLSEGFGVGLEMSGNPSAFHTMIDMMSHGGKIALLGIFSTKVETDWLSVIFKGLQIKGIYGREMFRTWFKMQSMLQAGLDISPVITHRFEIDDFEEGFEAARSGTATKVILDW